MTYAAIGAQLGVSRQRIEQVLSPPAAIRDIVLSRATGRCEECNIQVGTSGHVHHRRAKGLDCDSYEDIENLSLLCQGCHRRAHSTDPRTPRPKPERPAFARNQPPGVFICDKHPEVKLRCPACIGSKGGHAGARTPAQQQVTRKAIRARITKARAARDLRAQQGTSTKQRRRV